MAPYLLNDGGAVEIRPIRHDDSERLQEAHSRLSPESRYRRFLGAKPILSASDVEYLVDIDGSDHFALVATVPGGGEESIVAVARFVRLADDRAAAEFAIVVGDPYQRQGLASELLARLAASARERRIERFRGTILSDNIAIHRLIERFAGDEITVLRRGSLTEVEFPLPGVEGVRRRRAEPRPRSLRSSRRALEADRSLRT